MLVLKLDSAVKHAVHKIRWALPPPLTDEGFDSRKEIFFLGISTGLQIHACGNENRLTESVAFRFQTFVCKVPNLCIGQSWYWREYTRASAQVPAVAACAVAEGDDITLCMHRLQQEQTKRKCCNDNVFAAVIT